MSAHTLRKKSAKPSGRKALKLSGKRSNKLSGKKEATPSREKASPLNKKASPLRQKAKPSRQKGPTPARRRISPALSVKRSTAPSPRRTAALSETPTTEAFNDFVAWVNQTYQLQLPTLSDFEPGTLLYQIWSVTVEVTKNPGPGVVASARAKTSLIIVAKMSGLVYMDIRQSSIAGTSRLNSRR